MLISYTSKFVRKSNKLSTDLKNQLIKAEERFKKDPYDQTLRTHKLKGQLKDYYSFSINYSHRVLFSIEPGGSVVFIDIGDHSVYS